jgi:hypothetical protein
LLSRSVCTSLRTTLSRLKAAACDSPVGIKHSLGACRISLSNITNRPGVALSRRRRFCAQYPRQRTSLRLARIRTVGASAIDVKPAPKAQWPLPRSCFAHAQCACYRQPTWPSTTFTSVAAEAPPECARALERAAGAAPARRGPRAKVRGVHAVSRPCPCARQLARTLSIPTGLTCLSVRLRPPGSHSDRAWRKLRLPILPQGPTRGPRL